MKTITATVIVSFGLAASAFAQNVILNITAGKMEHWGLSFSVQTTVLTNTTQFTVSVTCDARHPCPSRRLLRDPEDGAGAGAHLDRKHQRQAGCYSAKDGQREWRPIPPSSTPSNQTSSVTYSFPVANEKLAHAAFMFWAPGRQFLERCYRLDLKPFTEKSNRQGAASGSQPVRFETNGTSPGGWSRCFCVCYCREDETVA